MLIIRTLTTWSTIQVFCNMGLIQLSYLALLFFCNSEFVQTGPNESLNSVTTLKYLEKSVSFR